MATPAAKHRVCFPPGLESCSQGFRGEGMERACCPGDTHSSTPKDPEAQQMCGAQGGKPLQMEEGSLQMKVLA